MNIVKRQRKSCRILTHVAVVSALVVAQQMASPAHAQQRPFAPRYLVEARIGREDQFRREVFGREIARDLTRHRSGRIHPSNGRLDFLGHRDKQVDPAWAIERRRPRRNQIPPMGRNPLPQLRFTSRVEPAPFE